MSEAHIRLTIDPRLNELFTALAALAEEAGGASAGGRVVWREDGHDVEALLTDKPSSDAVPGFTVGAGDACRLVRIPEENPWCVQCLEDAFPARLDSRAEAPEGLPSPAPRSSGCIRLPAGDAAEHAKALRRAVNLLVRRLDAARAVMFLGRTV